MFLTLFLRGPSLVPRLRLFKMMFAVIKNERKRNREEKKEKEESERKSKTWSPKLREGRRVKMSVGSISIIRSTL